MAYTSCAGAVAANIAPDCANPLVGGYTGRVVLFPLEDGPTFTVSVTNPREVTAITIPVGKKWIVLDNALLLTPLEGSQTASNGDAGKRLYTKTLQFRAPQRGGKFAKDVIDPLAESPLGFVAVAEKRDLVGNGSFEIVGKLQKAAELFEEQ